MKTGTIMAQCKKCLDVFDVEVVRRGGAWEPQVMPGNRLTPTKGGFVHHCGGKVAFFSEKKILLLAESEG